MYDPISLCDGVAPGCSWLNNALYYLDIRLDFASLIPEVGFLMLSQSIIHLQGWYCISFYYVRNRSIFLASTIPVPFFLRLKRASLTRQFGDTILFEFNLVSDTRRCPTQPEITMA
jgi:hypothetical protein